MGEEKRDFFISYNGADEQWAKWIAGILGENGYSTWIQAWDFRPGGNFVLDMQEALVKSKRFIAVLSQNYLKSLYCQAEWAAAFTKDPNSEKRLLIPVRVADVKPHGLFSAIIYIDLFGQNNEEMAEKLLLNGVDTEGIPRNRSSYPGTVRARFPGSLPYNNLPYIRNSYFTGRDQILKEIFLKFESGHTISLTQVLSGLGGLGKTQTALEYAYRYANQYDWIWWISAETESTVLVEYKNFAVGTKLLSKDETDRKMIIETVLNWMDTHEKWLFIYDNVDQLSTDTEWWPRANKGNILITTRNKRCPVGCRVDISVFLEDEAVLFLEKRTGLEHDRETEVELARRLGCLPLALEQAAAYIKNNEISYQEYLDLLKKYGLEMLDEMEGVLDYKKSITATWEISMDKIQKEPAKQLLYLCAYLGAEEIDPRWFRGQAKILPEQLKEEIGDERKSIELWSVLTKYSLLEKNSDRKCYSIHRLLQEVVRYELKRQGESQWMEYCLELLVRVFQFEDENIDSYKEFQRLVPHVEAFLGYVEEKFSLEEEKKKIAKLYSVWGWGNYCLGHYTDAIKRDYRALEIYKEICGEDHPFTGTVYNNLALVYQELGEYEKALEYYQKDLKICERIYGENHPSTGATYNNLGGVYQSLGAYDEALKYYGKALEIRERVYGEDHPATGTVYNNLGGLYEKLGKYEKALKYYEKALKICERVYGGEHPSTGISYNCLGGVYRSLGEYEKALKYYEKALRIREKIYGGEHPSIGTIYNGLGGVYQSLGEYEKALEYYKKALEIRERVFGKEHPATGTLYNNLGRVYQDQREYEKALEYYQKYVKICERVYGKEHSDTAVIYNSMGGVYHKQGQYEKALEYYEKALKIRERVYGKEHPATGTIYNNMGGVYQEQGEYEKALKYHEKDLKICQKVYGEEHPSTGISYYNIGYVNARQKKDSKALECYQKALNAFQKKLGPNHPMTKSVKKDIDGIVEKH